MSSTLWHRMMMLACILRMHAVCRHRSPLRAAALVVRMRRHGGRTIQHPSEWCENTRHDDLGAMHLKRRRGESGAHNVL